MSFVHRSQLSCHKAKQKCHAERFISTNLLLETWAIDLLSNVQNDWNTDELNKF